MASMNKKQMEMEAKIVKQTKRLGDLRLEDPEVPGMP